MTAHTATELHGILINSVLPRVEKPSRYVGGELNSVHKDPASVDLRVALAFPDVYDLGLGNLGLLILYRILNELPWCWAERAYAPAPDLETELRARDLPAFTQESKTPLGEVDLLGFTLQSELTYTTVLNMLDLGGAPLRSNDRGEGEPLVFAGGPGAYNPEPMAPFIDFFVIGEGEEAMAEIAETARAAQGRPRKERLEAIADVPGVYVPAKLPTETLPDGGVVPAKDAPVITRRLASSLSETPYAVRPVVPYAQQVHDRLGVEVMRGCTHGCRFCLAGMANRPVRERSLDAIDDLIRQGLDATGYEEAGLVSLSTCDYSRARELVDRAAAAGARRGVSMSLPSLRMDTFSVELADQLGGVRRTGLTFAPEAATDRLRAVINKWIRDEDLLGLVREAIGRGWQHVKCYFMIGLPTEREEDVLAIADLCARAMAAAKGVSKKARLHTGVSTFVPKPHTPFQWAAQLPLEETARRQALLAEAFKKVPGVRFGRHEPAASFVEGLVARGDRRAADLIEAAWRHGARLDTWTESLRIDAWRAAIEETGYDVAQALGEREVGQRLPWDHIHTLVSRPWLAEEWRRAQALELAPDCRTGRCHQCGVREQEAGLCVDMQRNHAGASDTPPAPEPREIEPPRVEAEPVARVRFRIGRHGETRLLSHLELVNAWIRALRRAGVPMAYSQGFHAHAKVQFATAPPVGEASRADYMDVTLTEEVEPGKLLRELKATLPVGLEAYECGRVPLRAPSLMSQATGFRYLFEVPAEPAALEARIAEILAADRLPVTRPEKNRSKKRRNAVKEVDLRPHIGELRLEGCEDGLCRVHAVTRVVGQRGIKPRELAELLGVDPAATRWEKRATLGVSLACSG